MKKLIFALMVLFFATQAHAVAVTDVTFNGNNADDYYQIPGNNDPFPNALVVPGWGDAFTAVVKANGGGSGTGSIGGVTFALNAAAGKNGTWTLSWSGTDLPATIDFAVVLTGGSLSYVAYFFDDVLLTADPTTGIGTYTVTFFNNGGNNPDLSHISIYARDLQPTPRTGEVPEPTTMLLFGTGLIGLAGISRRKRS
ncbi:MAG: PEP-CTERM sorting domain-containing protein [Proteobacteria bacterium]|nr:PEP-CTERM sorting domain-containing protein [Pseudomonadota bacterium]